ncbi:hypothetical protein MSPP1_002623 [Malassezia sp. CBS 17886]|nr:hypothetical protein MSPP1_002623 [Malassezia sp. CBS 17886]
MSKSTIDAEERVAEGGNGYEMSQQLRTKVVRMMKKKNYEDAINELYKGSIRLLEQKEEGSGCDLAEYMLQVYKEANLTVNDKTRERLENILHRTVDDIWRKRLIAAAVKWTIHASGNPLGDAKLRLYIAEMLAENKLYYDAEANFLAACAQDKAGVRKFAAMINEWNDAYASAVAEADKKKPSVDSVERVIVGKFAMRGWVPLLAAMAPEAASEFLHEFTSVFVKRNPTALLSSVKPNPRDYVSPDKSSKHHAKVFVTANPTLNLGQEAVELACDASKLTPVPSAVKKAWQDTVQKLTKDGDNSSLDSIVEASLAQISASTFQLTPPPRQVDMVSSMFSSLMGGGAPGPDANKKPVVKQLPKPDNPEESAADDTAGEGQVSEAAKLADNEMD